MFDFFNNIFITFDSFVCFCVCMLCVEACEDQRTTCGSQLSISGLQESNSGLRLAGKRLCLRSHLAGLHLKVLRLVCRIIGLSIGVAANRTLC